MLEIRRLIALEVNGEDVKADGEVAGRKLTHVMPGETAEDAALVRVDSYVCGRYGARRAGLHFNEAERIPFPGNDVEIAGGAGGAPSAGDYNVAAAHQPEKCGALAQQTCFEVLGPVWSPAGSGSLERVDRRLHQVDAEAEEHCAIVGRLGLRRQGTTVMAR
jgi:hypothetical protein